MNNHTLCLVFIFFLSFFFLRFCNSDFSRCVLYWPAKISQAFCHHYTTSVCVFVCVRLWLLRVSPCVSVFARVCVSDHISHLPRINTKREITTNTRRDGWKKIQIAHTIRQMQCTQKYVLNHQMGRASIPINSLLTTFFSSFLRKRYRFRVVKFRELQRIALKIDEFRLDLCCYGKYHHLKNRLWVVGKFSMDHSPSLRGRSRKTLRWTEILVRWTSVGHRIGACPHAYHHHSVLDVYIRHCSARHTKRTMNGPSMSLSVCVCVYTQFQL